MTTAGDRPDSAVAPPPKSRRRRASLSVVGHHPSSSLMDDPPVLAPYPPPIESIEDDGDAPVPPSVIRRSRSRSRSSIRQSKRGTASGNGAMRSRCAIATSIAAAKSNRGGLPDGRDALGATVYAISSSSSNNNNNEDEGSDCFRGEEVVEEEEARDTRRRQSRSRSRRILVPNSRELFGLAAREQEAATNHLKSERRTGTRPILPSRSHHYRQLSAGPTKSSIVQQHTDRPPSRQRHAFPIHLIDANAFCASVDDGVVHEVGTEGDVALDEDDHVVHPPQPAMNTSKNERPPSRYMTKSNRRTQARSASAHHRSSAIEDSTAMPQTEVTAADPNAEADAGGRRVPFRRLPSEYGGFSCNQAHHDPKTDGFADVDESIPPPFRIEITTESTSPPSPSSASSSPSPPTSRIDLGFTGRTSGRPPRHADSFSSSQHFQQLGHPKRAADGRAPPPCHSLKSPFNPLQWFGEDDQINNPDNFETVITASSPPHDDPGMEDDCGDSGNERDEDEDIEDAGHAPIQRPGMQPPPTASVSYKSGGHSWMVQSMSQSNNGKTLFKGGVPDYDSMDPDTAIAETPLFDSDDFMTIATQMSDLRLDDYSLADVMSTTSTGVANGNNLGLGSTAIGLGGAAPPLHTSLGRDFLSLFAQH